MKDAMYWLALAMAVVPFLEQALSDPLVTSRPWLSASIAGAIALARFAYKAYVAAHPPTPPVDPNKPTVVSVK